MFVQQLDPLADYQLFIGSLSSWFRAEVLKELDEEGIPVQIAERFYADGDSKNRLIEKLKDASSSSEDKLTDFEKEWLADALLGD